MEEFLKLQLLVLELTLRLMTVQVAQAKISPIIDFTEPKPPEVIIHGLATITPLKASFSPSLPVIFERIAKCESGGRQFDDKGEVLTSVTQDYGFLQINHIHDQTAKEMGLDIRTLEGNIKYAEFLYSQSGLKPWAPSAKCWSK